MFKRLRERIAEEATKFPVGQLNNSSGKSDSENKMGAENSTEDLITLSDSSSVVVPHTSSKQFSIGDEDGSMSEQNTPQKKQHDTSSSSTSEQSFYSPGQRNHPQGIGPDLGYVQEYRPSKSSYIPQSDIESEREDPPTLNLEGISKDQLLTIIDLLKARSHKYKNKYSEVVKNYKEIRDEKLKIENTLIEHQDKGLRRMAELREQCQLEQKAKAHLEANLRLLLEEKDSRISVLETQINLLKEGGKIDCGNTFPDSCDTQNSDTSSGDLPSDSSTSMTQDHSILKEKIERLEHQFSQAKKTITSQTDQISLLRKQSEGLSQELEEKVKRLNEMEDEQVKLTSEHENILKNMQIRLEELENQQEDSVMSMAETKRNMHEELEFKEQQLKKAEEEAKQYQTSCESEKLKVLELQKQHAEKINELQRQLESMESMLEDEKQNLMQELARGKSAAITLMQQECAKKVSAIEVEWKAKLQELQTENSKQSQIEDADKEVLVMEKRLKWTEKRADELNSIILQLEKENEILKTSLEKLESDFAFTTAKLEKLQVEYWELKELNEKEALHYEEKFKQELDNRLQGYEQTESEHHYLREFLKEQLNEKQNVIDDMVHNKNALYNQIDELEKTEKELRSKTDHLENEVKELNSHLQELKVKLEEVTESDNLKRQEIQKLHENINQMQLNDKTISNELAETKEAVDKLNTKNKNLESKFNLLNTDYEEVKHKFLISEEKVSSLNNMLNEATLEFDVLNKCIDQKLSMFSHLTKQYENIGLALTSLENEDQSLKSAFLKHETICNEVCEHFINLSKTLKSTLKRKPYCEKHVSSDLCTDKITDNNLKTCATEKSSVEDSNKSESQQEMQGQTEGKMHDRLLGNNHVYASEKDKLKHPDVKGQQCSTHEIVEENQKLKQELSELKDFSEIQNIEFAKNITELHKSLNELQDERNNLSLVLQSIETQSGAINPQSETLVKAQGNNIGSSDIIYKGIGQNEYALDIMKLNNKVKSEIAALSAQTEMINQELRTLREQFNLSQLTYSEKVAHLNSKLMFRTEQLICIKNDLDASVQNGEDLKCLLDTMKKQLIEKDDVLKASEKHKQDLENRCKALKEQYIKKELSLKQMHNSQLNDLKNQTKATIDKLNEEIQRANATLKEHESEFNSQDSNIKEQYNQGIHKLITNPKFETAVNQILDSNKSLETHFNDSLTKLDVYGTKIININSNLKLILLRLQEKESLIKTQQIKIDHLEEQVKFFPQENEDLKFKLKDISILLEETKSDLEQEKRQKKISEENVLVLSEKYEAAIQKIKEINSSNKVETEKITSLLEETVSDLDVTNMKYAKVCASLDETLAQLKNSKAQNVFFEELQTKSNTLVKDLECVKESLEKEKRTATKAVNEWKSLYEKILCNFNEFASNCYENMEQITLKLTQNEDKFRVFESLFSKASVTFQSQKVGIYKLKNEIEKLEDSNQNLLVEIESQKVNLKVQSEFEDLEQKFKNITETDKALREEIQKELNDSMSKLKTAKEENQLQHSEIANLQCKLRESLASLKDSEKRLEVQSRKLTEVETSVVEWEDKYNLAIASVEDLSISIKETQFKLQLSRQETTENNALLASMIPKEELENYKKLNADKLKQMNFKIEDLQKMVDTLTTEVIGKEALIDKIKTDQRNLETHHDDNIKCMKDKLENAERNYATQMEEMKSRILLLEKEKSTLEAEKNELLKVQEKLSELKSVENAVKSELKSKEAELHKLQQKYETTNKDQVAKIHSFQETMKDKENTILKLKANLESLTKENLEKNEELRKKIKVLEQEREQLMIQAQERVSTTEAKCREDIKSLQEKNNKLLVENSEIEKLISRISQLDKQLCENRSLAESNEAAAQEEILRLKDQLVKAEEKLSQSEKLKESSEAELVGKLKNLQEENSSLLGKSNHFESLKAEKEELNEKLKQAERQVTSIKLLETEKDTLINENSAILKELELLKARQAEEVLTQKDIESSECENNLRIELEELKNCKENLESKLSELKASFEAEIKLLKSENEKLLKQVGMLEKFHSSRPESTALKDYIAVVRGECETAIKAKEEEMDTKLKHLVRDFCIQMDVKDKDCDKMMSDMIEKSQNLEESLLREHRKEAAELRQNLFEKECALDEIRDHYEETLQKKEKRLKELQSTVKKLTEISQSDITSNDVAPLAEEGSDWDDTWAMPEESVENTSPIHEVKPCTEHLQQIESLQDELSQCNSEIKELKVLLRLSPPESMVNNNNRRDSMQSIPEPTEFEYLKNIIYEYMMGKEPITLAKVIAAVLRFSDSQTQQVIRREEARHPMR